jgi:hypothetical protein
MSQAVVLRAAPSGSKETVVDASVPAKCTKRSVPTVALPLKCPLNPVVTGPSIAVIVTRSAEKDIN